MKDILWEELNKESNKIEDIVHRPKDVTRLQQELKDMGEDEDIIYEYEEEADDDDEDIDYEYEEEDWEEKWFHSQKIKSWRGISHWRYTPK